MTREEAIQEACSIISLVYHSIGDYSEPSDCFCDNFVEVGNYRNSGIAIDYVRQAVIDKLTKDGFKVHSTFNPTTGKEKVKE